MGKEKGVEFTGLSGDDSAAQEVGKDHRLRDTGHAAGVRVTL
jgi:hypothetical protein